MDSLFDLYSNPLPGVNAPSVMKKKQAPPRGQPSLFDLYSTPLPGVAGLGQQKGKDERAPSVLDRLRAWHRRQAEKVPAQYAPSLRAVNRPDWEPSTGFRISSQLGAGLGKGLTFGLAQPTQAMPGVPLAEPQTTGEKVAHGAGYFAGSLLPFGASSVLAGQPLVGAAKPLIGRIASPLGRMAATGLVHGAGQGIFLEGGKAIAEGRPVGEVATSALKGAALYGGTEAAATAALGALGLGAKAALQKITKRGAPAAKAAPRVLKQAKPTGVAWQGRLRSAADGDQAILSRLAAKGEAQPVKVSEIIKGLEERLGVPIRTGRTGKGKKVLGIFKVKPEVIRSRKALDIETISHEVGHFLDKKLGLAHPRFDAELMALGKATSAANYTADQIRREGIAEWMRLYLTNVDEAARTAPGFTAQFEQVLNQMPELKSALSQAKEMITSYRMLPAKERVLARISTEGTKPKARVFEEAYKGFVDELRPLQRAVQDITGGAELSISQDPYRVAWLSRGWTGKARQAIERSVMNAEGKVIGPSLKQVLKPVADNLDDFRAYIVARRAAELQKRGIETGFAADDVAETLKTLGSDKFKTAADQLVKFQDQVLELFARETGLVSESSLRALRELNQNYVPMYRVFTENPNATIGFGSRGFVNLPSPIRRIKGSSREIIDPLESIIKNTYTLANIGERNAVGRALVDLAEQFEGAGKWVEKVPTPVWAQKFQLSEIKKALKDSLLSDQPIESIVDLEKAATLFRPAGPSAKENILTVWRGGKPEFFQVDPELYQSLRWLDRDSASWYLRMLSIPSKTLRAGAILDPGFVARNPLRDQPMAYIQSRYGYRPGTDFVRGLFSVLRRDKMYQQWQASGGAASSFVSMDRSYLQNNLRDLLADDRSLIGALRRFNPLESLRALSELTEEATRLGEFARGVTATGGGKEGLMEAALASREVTLDFARKGVWGKDINLVNAFWNAGVQGLDKIARSFTQNPKQFTSRAIKAITLPTIALFALNHKNPAYKEIPRWQRDLFWHIPLPSGGFVKIPKPFELGLVFGTLPERALEWIVDQDKTALDQLGEAFGSQLESLSPLRINAIYPLFEVAANYSMFHQRPIVPRSEEKLPPEMQYGPYTTQAARTVGEMLNVSPRKVEHLARGYAGTLPMTVARAVDPLLGAPPKPDEGMGERIPGVQTLLHQKYQQAESIDRFYRELSRLETEARGAKERNQRFREKPKLDRMKRISRDLSDLRKRVEEVLSSQRMSPQAKKKELDRLQLRMVNLARKALGEESVK